MQQDTVFKDWWVVAEHRRKLGFIGRVAASFTEERFVHPENRRDAAYLLREAIGPVWIHAARAYGQGGGAPASCVFSSGGAEAYGALDLELGVLRSCRDECRYGLRTVLGKAVYWIPSYAFLMECAQQARAGVCTAEVRISDNALKLSMLFLAQRPALAGTVLDTEIAALTEASRSSGSAHRGQSTLPGAKQRAVDAT